MKKYIETQLKEFARGKSIDLVSSGIQNCVIYTRVSSKEQMDTNQSLEWQKKYCYEYAVKNKLVIKGYFGGTYESAKSDERKEFNRMLKWVKASKEKISYILVYSLDRFSRTGDSAIYIAGELKKIGVSIMAVTQPIDTNSHAGALQQNIQFIFSKYDNDLRRQKTIDGMREKLLRGEWIGNAPTGYSYVKGAVTQTIVIDEKGEAMKQAFHWRAKGMTYEQIIAKLKLNGITITKQTLSDIFRNPFYCGFMSHNLLNGEIIKGKHTALIDEQLFLKVNQLNQPSFTVNKVNENLPLKVFVKDADTNIPFAGYLVKKKGLYYYKVNKVGAKINRSAKVMHDKFKEVLDYYTIEPIYVEPVKVELINVWDSLTENNANEKKSLSVRLTELENDLYEMEKNHALGRVRVEIFDKYSTELYEKKEGILKELEKLNQTLSNPKELINFTVYLSANLSKIWTSSDYYQKQAFQHVLFPKGLGYDAKIDHYRTPIVNSAIRVNAELARGLGETKNRTSQFFVEKSGSVPSAGLEPARFPTGV